MRPLLLMFSLLLLAGCREDRPKLPIVKAAYYWKSDFAESDQPAALADSLGVRSVYVKFFEVDWNALRGEAMPLDRQNVSPFEYEKTPPGFEIIPTIFITNRTLAHTDSAQVGKLAWKISKKLLAMLDKMGNYQRVPPALADQPVPPPTDPDQWPTRRIGRIQIDCDWTASTRARYFDLLRDLKVMLQPCELSVTIRLYPFKYPEKMGVPPVDRGMLMCYNLRPFNRLEDKNSILDLATARQYLADARPYPLPLDVALPVFSWGVLFRKGAFRGLINHLGRPEVERLGYFRPQGRLTYVSTVDTSFASFFLRRGDVLRVEQVPPADLEALAALTRPLTTPHSRVALFSLDTTLFNHYPYAQLENVYARYR